MNLKGTKILITGGDRGIGRHLVEQLILKGASHIAIMSRSLSGFDSLKEQFHQVELKGIKGNVTDITDLKNAISAIEEDFGGLDILINNAGVVSAAALEDLDDDDITTQLDVNLKGPILLTKYTLPLLKKSSRAAIVNISSGLGLIGMPFYTVYGSTKAAIKQFSDSMRRELQPYNINVLCVYPTATDTDMMKTSSREASTMDTPEYVAQLSIEALENEDIQVIFGGRQREKDALFNFAHPELMDQEFAQDYDALKKKISGHKSF